MKKRLLTLALALMLAMASLAMLASCDLSGLTGGGGTTCTSHKDENKDHKCDTCEKVLTTCADTDKDHKCDLCGKALSECKDEDGDHACDLCEKTLGACEDKNNDHKCDICEEVLTACADTDNDHKCDTCDETLTQCADGDTDGRCDICGEAMGGQTPPHTCADTDPKDHKCDVCDKKLSEHTDQNNDHRCDHCHNRATYCADADNDHACDICTEVKTSCMDGDNNGVCDICGEAVTVTEGADGSALRTENLPFAGCYGVAATNTATDFSGSTLYFLPGLDSYRFYLYFSFELDDLVFTDGAEYGSFVAEEGYIKDGRFIVPVTYTPNGTQLCTEIGVQYMQFTKRATGQTNYLTRGVHLRFVLNCVVPSFLGVSADGNYANASDTVTINFTDIVNAPAEGFYIYLHFDNQVGGGRIHGNNFNNYRNYALYEDGIYTLKCELNAAQIGSHKPIITFSYIPAPIGLAGIVDLYNTFTLVVEPGTPCAECSENKQYPDGHCDTCGNPLPPCDHTDTDKDHKCDLCTETISQCADEDGDHFCDLCEERMTYCYDRTGDHLCDLCNERLACNDANRDHKCDICEEKLSDCFDNAGDGICDICGNPTKSVYEQYLKDYTFNDDNCPVLRVAVCTDYAPYLFVNRGLARDEWFCGADALMIRYLAKSLGYKIEYVPLSREACITAIQNGEADCAIGALRDGLVYEFRESLSYHYAENPITGYQEYFHIYCSEETMQDLVYDINDLILPFREDENSLYKSWIAAAEAYIDTLPPLHLDDKGYDANGNKIGGNEDRVCPHIDAVIDHYCDTCHTLLNYYVDDIGHNGICDICNEPLDAHSKDAVGPSFVGLSYTPDGTYNDNGRIFFHSKATTTVYLKFTKPVTMQPLTLNNHAITFAEYSHTEDEYIVSATFTINTFGVDGTQPFFEWKDFFGKKHSKSIGVYRIPEFAGAAENGTITSGPLTFTEGASFVVQLATAGQAEITALYIGDTELTFSLGNVQSIQVSIPNYGSTHGNLYTLTVTDGAHVPYGESEITVRYKVAGTPSGDGAPFSDFKITVNKKKAVSEEATKDTYLSLLEALQQANNATAEWRVAIAPELAPYLFSDLSLATDDWFVGAEILFIHRLAYEMNYRVVLVPLSKEGCITALKNGMADAAIGCFTAEEKNALGVLSSQAYAAIIDPAAIAPTELFVLVAANRENDLSMIDKAIDFIQSEGAYDTWLAAAQSYVDASEAENIDEYGYYADGKKIDASGVCNHEDENGDHRCDNCDFEGMFCEDGNYDGYCDSCYLPIAGADLLMDPRLVGYGTDPTEGFFEALGMIELKYGVATTLYLKFNCEVKDFSVHFPSGEAASTHYYTDPTGAVYRIEIPAFDHIFPQGGTDFSFATDYAESSAIISYCCLPDTMPEYLGAMVNGALSYETVTVKQGESATVQFAMNVAVNLDYLSLDGNYLEISEWSVEPVEDGGEIYYLYTVTFSLQDISADEFELGIKYSYLGASTEGFDGMLPMFTIRVSVSRYNLLGATVNGLDVLNSMVQIPHSEVYEILLSVNQSADAIRLATEMGVLEGDLFSEQGFYVYRFTVTEFPMSYVTAQVFAVSGNTEFLFGALSFEILAQTGGEGSEGSEGGEGGEGGGGMTEVRVPNIDNIYDCVNEISVQETDVFHVWADGKLSIQITFDIPVAESYIKWNDMIYTAESAPEENSYYYTVAMPMSASKEEGTFRLCFYDYENDIWFEPYEFSYKKEAAAFYGIYIEPLVPDIDNPSSSVYLPEGQPATVYLAMTAAVEPMELYIAGIDSPINPLYSPWQEGGMTFTDDDGDPFHIWFYTVELPAEVMSSEYETIKLVFLQADPDPAGNYDDIYETYSISIVPAV